MDIIKNWFLDIKKMTVLGLISVIILFAMDIPNMISVIKSISVSGIYVFNLISFLPALVLVVYFIFECIKLYTKNDRINLKALKIIMVISFICTTLIESYMVISSLIFLGFHGTVLLHLPAICMQVLICVYLFYTLVLNKTTINNKIYACANIVYFLIIVITCLIEKENISVLAIVSSFIGMLYVPYFYDYYELLRDKNKNR